MKKYIPNKVLSWVLVLVLGLVMVSIIPVQNAKAQTINVTVSFNSNPGTQGESNAVNLYVSNPNANQVFITSATIKFEWRQLPYTWSGNVGIASQESKSISISFDVPSTAQTTAQSYQLTINYNYQGNSEVWSDSSSFRVQEKGSIMGPLVLASIVIAVIAIIAVIAVIYLYTKRKPIVHVTQEVREPESPPTRIKLPGERAPSDTRVGSSPSRSSSQETAVSSSVIPHTAAITGAVVLMPNGQTKAFEKEVVFGRKDFEGMIPSDLQNKISREHLKIYSSKGKYYVEDGYSGQSSTNGTKLNSKEIRSLGPQMLNDGDTIKLANAADIKIKLPISVPSTVVESSASSTVMKTAVMSQILELSYDDKKMSWSVSNELIIGREEFRGKLLDDKVNMISSKHCRIYRDGSKYFIEDGYDGKPSTNGTKVNDETIKGAKQIKKGDTINIAGVVTIDVKSIG